MLSDPNEEQEKDFARIIDRIEKSVNELYGKDTGASKRWLESISEFKI